MNDAMMCRNLWTGREEVFRAHAYERENVFEIQDLSFTLVRGQITGLAGNMETDKAQLLLALAGHVKWDKGQVVFYPKEPAHQEWTYQKDEARIRRMVSFCFEHMEWPAKRLVSEMAADMKKMEPWFDEALFRDLTHRLAVPMEKTFGALSSGMKKRLQLALMMARRPEILILDEPCAEVDPPGRERMLTLLQEFMEEEDHAILLSTNMTDDLDRIADRIIILDAGRLAYSGSMDECKEKYSKPGCPLPTLEELMLAMHEQEK